MSYGIVEPAIKEQLDQLQEIFKNCLKNNRNSQRWLYEKYFGYALKIAFRYTYSFEESSIVTNDSFVKAFKNLKHLEIDTDETTLELRFRGWLRGIVINTSIDNLRKSSREIAFEQIDESHWCNLLDTESADATLMYKELICYLRELPPAYQRVFNLYVIDGYNHNEIAELLNISAGTSKSNLARAKQILQNKLSDFFEINKV